MPQFALRLATLAMTLSSMMIATVYAQSFFNTQTTQSTSGTSPGSTKIMTPDEFKNTVTTLDQQTKDAIKQQLHAEMPTPTPAPLSSPPISHAQPTAGTMQNGTTSNASQPPQRPAVPPSQTLQAPPTQPAPPSSMANQPIPHADQPQQSEIYTGFIGNQEKKGEQAKPNEPASGTGGWNVKY